MSTAMVSLVLAVLVLPSATTAAVTADRRNCSHTCGKVGKIPYPFGLGPSCSLPDFRLTCADNTSYPMLGNLSIMGFSRSDNYPHIPNNLLASISYSVKMIPGVRDYSLQWEAPAPHFAVSSYASYMYVVGCGVKASLFLGNSTFDEVRICSVACAEARFMEKLPKGTCDDGIEIYDDLLIWAFTLNISRTSDSARSKKVYAFISEDMGPIFRPIDALRSMLPAGPEFNPSATLEWAIPYQPNCKRAMEDRPSYACVAHHSVCVDSPIGGYFCECDQSDKLGNPYINGGCLKYQQPPEVYYSSIQPRKDCPRFCGNVSIPFPFGTKPGCFATEQFYLKCFRNSSGTVLLVFESYDRLVVTDISIDDGILLVDEKSEPVDLFTGPDTLYALSG